MKKILTVFCMIAILMLGLMPCYADAPAAITLETKVDYDNEKLTVSGVTPAAYGQKISVAVYKPSVQIDELADVTDQANPEAELPLDALTQLVRAEDVIAAYDGNYSMTLSLVNSEPGFYVVSVSGNGTLSSVSKASTMIYFETQQYINETTLPAINSAGAAEIDTLIRQKELLFGVSVDADYETNQSTICSMFADIRDDDYDGSFTRMGQVQDTFSAISAIRSLTAAADKAALKSICETNAALFGLNLTDADYVGHEDAVYTLMLGLIQKTPPTSMKGVRTLFQQAIALVTINRTVASNMTDCITQYAETLGISLTDYQEACDTYGAGEINKAFIEQNFKTPQAVVSAFTERLDNPPDTGGNGGNGGNGSSGNSSSKRGGGTVGISSSLVDPPKTEPSLGEAKFYDVPEDHWAFMDIQSLAEMGVLTGTETGGFAPDDKVSREQFTKMLVLALDLPEEGAEAEFSDVAAERWSAAYIAAAAKQGIVTGYEDGTFAPADFITRQDAAVILHRACTVKKVTLAEGEVRLTDADSVSEYAQASVTALAVSGIISGFPDGSFQPFGTLTRAQAAKMIYEIVLR